uniref:helix-turn-helix domain-containing protein n=1 Tax=Stappia indica TaxID=538381 RepID=UPI0038501F10
MTQARVYTPDMLADEWHVCANTIRNLIKRGELRAVRFGRHYRIPAGAVEEFLQCQSTSSQSAGSKVDTSSRGETVTRDDGSVFVLKHARTPTAKR